MTTTMNAYRELNIVILGASFGGLAAAHHVFQKAIPELRNNSKNFSYRITIISPSNCMFWNISAPKAIISTDLLSQKQSFIPLEEAFEDFDPQHFEFIQGSATDLDTKACTITVRCPAIGSSLSSSVRMSAGEEHGKFDNSMLGSSFLSSHSRYPNSIDIKESASPQEVGFQRDSERMVKYHALIIATGSTAISPLLSLRGPHEITRTAIDIFQNKLSNAKTVIIAGGGCSGVEVTGQIAQWCNERQNSDNKRQIGFCSVLHRMGFPLRWMPNGIMLISGSDRLLPKLDARLGAKAERQLKQLGVQVMLGVRVEGVSEETETGRTAVKLSDGTHLLCDCFVPCTGVLPNTQFLQVDSPLLHDGFMVTSVDVTGHSTLRVDVPRHLLPDNAVKVNSAKNWNIRKAIFENTGDDTASPGVALPHIYALGDCADYSKQCLSDVYAPVAVLIRNFILDLKAYQVAVTNPYGENQKAIRELYDCSISYARTSKANQLIPIGGCVPGGVGVLQGCMVPSWMVHLLKGRNFAVNRANVVVKQGLSPFPAQNQVRRPKQK